VLGDVCGTIALAAWWVLDKTGSAVEMSSILAPARMARILLLPVCGSIADRYSRKTLLVVSDLWRFIFSALILAMAAAGYYNFPLVLLSYTLLSAGSALFGA
jgi:DHA3 family macrolide efflux protein-like MFS transporter